MLAAFKFIYYGEKKFDPMIASDLLVVAKQFGMPKLGELCEKGMAGNITADSVLEILRVSFEVSAKKRARIRLFWGLMND